MGFSFSAGRWQGKTFRGSDRAPQATASAALGPGAGLLRRHLTRAPLLPHVPPEPAATRRGQDAYRPYVRQEASDERAAER
jgi:hypothetical protein